VKRRDEGLTTEDLAGTGTQDDLRIEEDDQKRLSKDEVAAQAKNETGEREPIPAGPAGETPIILDEREGSGSFAANRDAEQALPADVAPERVDLGEDEGTHKEVAPVGDTDAARPLVLEADREEFISRWRDVQFRFVEEPRAAVHQADGLVAELMQRLAQMFADARSNLESQWNKGDQVSTEDLRVAFQRYREFFDRLLQT
jgi:hypothetical protein